MVLAAFIALFIKYGLFGLFLSSFISSLFFVPAFAPFLIPLFIELRINHWYILIAITTGAIIGQIINYYFGFIGSKYIFKMEAKKASKWLNKWGDMSIFIINLIPMFPADIVSCIVGFLKMDLKMFMISMSLAKLIQYSLLIFGTGTFFKFFSII